MPIDYDVEEVDGRPRGVARLRLPEKLARTLTEEELPALDRPVRFIVLRGPRGAVRATTLDELQEVLDRPWSPDEVATARRADRPHAGRRASHARAGSGVSAQRAVSRGDRHETGATRDREARRDSVVPAAAVRGRQAGSLGVGVVAVDRSYR